jgi:epoxide hydrolase-like predicted phosphatase
MRTVPIRAIVFDIGGVLEVAPDGREPMAAFDGMVAAWESRLGAQSGALRAHLERGRTGGLVGAYTEQQWQRELRAAFGMSAGDLAAFVDEFWDLYLGALNVELADYLRGLRAHYRTALLSNSFVGAREREHERYGFGDLTETIVYSHEVGVAKPDARIYTITCERLGVRPDEIVFLDDVEAYIASAREAGLEAVLYRDTAQAISEIEALLQPARR